MADRCLRHAAFEIIGRSRPRGAERAWEGPTNKQKKERWESKTRIDQMSN